MKTAKQRITAKAVHYCLKNLGDPVALKRSPLTELPQVIHLSKRYNKSSWARAYALRDVVTSACAEVLTLEASDRRMQRALAFLHMFMEKPNAAAAARTLGIDRKNVYTYIMPLAFDLVAEMLEQSGAPTTINAA